MSNPWSQMPSNARRRVAKTKFDLFWVVDESGQFAFSVLSNHKEKEDELKIRGINTKIRKFGEKTEVFVVINSNEEWRILEKICNDLTQVANEEVAEEAALVTAVWQRLKRWKRFFGEQTAKSQTELYAQLLFIQLAAQAVGFKRLLRAWEPRLRPNFYFEKSEVLVRACDARGYNLLNAMGNELAGELSLCAFNLRANKGKTTLLYQAEHVAQRLQNEELKALFARKLESVKVVLGVKDEYTSFEVIDFNTFGVKEGFARIVVNDSRIEGFGYTQISTNVTNSNLILTICLKSSKGGAMSEAINIGEFYEDLMQKVRVAGGDSEAFFEEVCQTLEEDGEFEGYNAAYCERKVGSRKAECSGWGYEEARGRLNLFAACFEQSENLATFSREEIESKIKRLSTFLEYCHDANLLDLEQSADEYEMIKQVKQRLENGEVSSVCFYILSNLRVNRERLSEELSHAFVRELNCEVKLIDIEELFRGFKSKGGNFEVEGVRFRALKVPQNEGYESYLAVISAADLARIYDRFGGRLLEKNIRTFLQFKGGVNRGVRNTIKNAPHKFFAYNNGITAVADAVELDGNYIVKIKNFQVVNGAQSMSCVYDAFKNKIDLSQVFLQMKLCVERQQEESEFVSQIAQYSNTQNNVKKSDFFSNHPFHLEFKRFSRECLAPQAGGWQCKTRWFYERARGEYQNEQKYLTEADKRRFLNENPKSQLFDKIYLARVLTAFDGKPNEAAKSAQKAFIKFAEKVANDDNFKVSEYFFKECIAKIILFKKLEELAPRMRGRVYVAFFALALVGERLARQKSVLDIEKIWQNQAVSNSLRQTLQKICDFTAEFLTQNGEISYTECGKFEFYQRFCKADFEVKFDELDILSQEEAKAAAKDSRKDAELVAEADKMKFVHQFYKDEAAKRMWRRLFEYYQEENFRALSPKQKSDLEYFLSGQFVPMNEKQCGVLYQIYSKAKAEGANLGEI